MPLAPPVRAPRRMLWPMAAAAGVVVVAGVLVVLRQAGPAATSNPSLMAGGAPALGLPLARNDVQNGAGEQAQMLRDARVDEYLRAHRETMAASPAALPGGGLRSVDFTVPQR